MVATQVKPTTLDLSSFFPVFFISMVKIQENESSTSEKQLPNTCMHALTSIHIYICSQNMHHFLK
ncbi:hypothetical protein Ahy_A02g006510 isoform B [Arachis hypogaea]|uniref:Uncharacterized protein n=1 Tax=Arachis hypogaea TaxID=3818 RepID=A0A445EA54_ARAHY|nr:hypothetical protein Ahy_A02g006510 isoform B [Arachis hypogaea]